MDSTSDSDSETLEAVVAFIDAFQSTDSEDASLSPPPSHSDASEDSEKPRTKKRPIALTGTRARQRREKEELRLLVERLQSRVDALEQEELLRQEALRIHAHERNDKRSQLLQRGMVSVWKRVAVRQKQRRREAEKENSRLKECVTKQQEVAANLHRLIARQVAEATDSTPTKSFDIIKALSHSSFPSPDETMLVFSDLVSELNQFYAANAPWTQVPDLSIVPTEVATDSRVTMLSPSCLAIELVNVQLLPFQHQVAADGYWQLNHSCEWALFDVFGNTSEVDGRAMILRAQMVDDPAIGQLRRHLSMQKIHGNDQTVIATVARCDSLRIGDQTLRGAQLREQYAFVFRPPEKEAQSECLLTASGRIVVDFGSIHLTEFEAMSALSTYYTTKMHEHLQWAVGNMEDRLLGL
ncbi:hypothetical protein Poli38472_007516 [Pythium oligandrum]|uniref:Uncharacterized protein n=1 Tax=Pythium oligandrum TaxID=41045 RepID=A0A8K1FNZ4_PYTOL|nr:hypothetical protein Poli38472_007516 [Pythium oligandrum]|eukprot:TMW67844.1 hypothetical protein Poli38472_007516 [Pythium oligandrum]